MNLYNDGDKERYYTNESKKLFDDGNRIRDDFYKDYCRIIHSPSFRRLQSKCQLFPIGESDFFRNRLTHSLEVAQIGKGIATLLNQKPEFKKKPINSQIVEFAGLAHDLGHPPFGHQGEKALDDCMAQKYGGFEGNAQTLRILTKIEKKIKDEDSDDYGMSASGKDFRYGLNLTYRTLGSVLKYDHKITNRTKIKFSKDNFFEEYVMNLQNNKKGNYESTTKKRIETLKQDLGKKLDFDRFKESLVSHGVITDEGYPADKDTFYENVNVLPLDRLIREYEAGIKDSLKSWYEKVKMQKGYYKTEAEIVKQIKKHVAKDAAFDSFKTIECQIMDIADDIAFSTYDLEDALKGNFVSIFDCLSPNVETLNYITRKINESINLPKENYTPEEVIKIFIRIFDEAVKLSKFEETYTIREDEDIGQKVIYCFNQGEKYNNNGYFRTYLTSSLVGKFIKSVNVIKENKTCPALTQIALSEEAREEVEVLRHFTFFCLISSSLLKIPAHRGYEIVKTIFDELQKPDGYKLLPPDYKHIYVKTSDDIERKRILCDFISGMTDRYVLEFYGRLKSENPQTIFKPI